jgi:hypothetical protein
MQNTVDCNYQLYVMTLVKKEINYKYMYKGIIIISHIILRFRWIGMIN